MTILSIHIFISSPTPSFFYFMFCSHKQSENPQTTTRSTQTNIHDQDLQKPPPNLFSLSLISFFCFFFCVQASVFLQKNLGKILFQYVFNFSYVHVLKNIESNQILFIIEIVTLFIVLGTVDMLFVILVSTRGSNLLLS
jgi:hypothetical protein